MDRSLALRAGGVLTIGLIAGIGAYFPFPEVSNVKLDDERTARVIRYNNMTSVSAERNRVVIDNSGDLYPDFTRISKPSLNYHDEDSTCSDIETFIEAVNKSGIRK